MAINQRQFEQLSEMGISLWKSRACNENLSEQEKSNRTNKVNYLEIDLPSLSNSQLFIDILNSADISIGEITLQEQHLDCGLFNWAFINVNEQETLTINYQENILITPSINDISQSPHLKKQLWQILSCHVL